MNYKKRDTFLVFGKPSITDDEISEVVDTLKSGWIGTGPKTKRFEQEFANYIGAKYAVALNSCTAGLQLSLLALGIGAGDEVITTPLTFCATANTIIHVGATPVFIDIEKDTFNINPDLIEQKITPKTKAIIPVHIAGRPCDMDKIMAIAKKHNLYVIEDSAHATESFYKDKKVGNIGNIGCFSFYVNKNITTAEGGMITTNDSELAEKIKILSLHGMNNDAWKRFSSDGYKHYDLIYAGYKYNMTDIQSSLGLHQLKNIEVMLKRREEIWNLYDNELKNLPIILPKKFDEQGRHARHLYQILIDDTKTKLTRDEILTSLVSENIGTGVHYISLHLLKYYKEKFDFKPEDFPHAKYVSDRILSLPLTPYLTDEDVFDVINALKKIFISI
jgi:dTDP-4-amino-4,6-dideoxygalactose transaminase